MMALLAALLVYLLILLVVAFAALRPARSPIFLSPEVLGAPIENAEFESEGIVLRGWWVPRDTPRAVAILMHGYVMNRAENAGLAAALYESGFACLLFDLRASGKSGGKQVGLGWLERVEVLAACRLADKRYPGVPRVLIGSSMGAAAAAFALEAKPDAGHALILDSCYHRLPSATIGWWRFIGGWPAAVLLAPVVLVAWPLSGMNPFRVCVGRALTRSGKPVLILHGRRDKLVAPFHAERNHASAVGPKRLVWFDDAGHSEMRWTEPDRFLKELLDFLESEEVIRPQPSYPC